MVFMFLQLKDIIGDISALEVSKTKRPLLCILLSFELEFKQIIPLMFKTEISFILLKETDLTVNQRETSDRFPSAMIVV